MTRYQMNMIRSVRALEVLRKHATDDDWEKVVECLEKRALELINKKRQNSLKKVSNESNQNPRIQKAVI